MVYAVSDLHGCYELHLKMLDKIKLSKDDTLYVLGDVSDRGKDGIRIMQDIMSRKNIICLVGNHEYTAYTVLKRLSAGGCTESEAALLKDWIKNGGGATYDAFMTLPRRERSRILAFIENMAVYKEITVGGRRFALSHAGIGHFDRSRPLDSYPLDDFIRAETDYDSVYFDDRFLVSGHTPTALIDIRHIGRIYRRNHHIAIDCGAVFCGTLGCIRLDDLTEFYVSE